MTRPTDSTSASLRAAPTVTRERARWLRGDDPNRAVRLVGAYDAITAKLASTVGFEGLWAGSLSVSTSCGYVDHGQLPLSRLIGRVEEMRRASSAPILVDVDGSHTEAGAIREVIRLLESCGASGVAIEDKRYPKRNSFEDGPQELHSERHFCGLLGAALDSRRQENFAVIARTESLVAGETVDRTECRSRRYLAEGIDGIIIQSVGAIGHLSEIVGRLRAGSAAMTIGVIPTAYSDISVGQWLAFGASLIIYANQLTRSVVLGVEDCCRMMVADNGLALAEKRIATVKALLALNLTLPE